MRWPACPRAVKSSAAENANTKQLKQSKLSQHKLSGRVSAELPRQCADGLFENQLRAKYQAIVFGVDWIIIFNIPIQVCPRIKEPRATLDMGRVQH